ncbi:MAG TPA: hypothetical protein VHY35_04825 [Stellaceae bacterium]|jgi:hypothetical protein|nr:hypothetical protein [Stellaceae bacterium]
MNQIQKLRELATWYRQYAERANSSFIWDARLRTAEDLEQAACRLENGDNNSVSAGEP